MKKAYKQMYLDILDSKKDDDRHIKLLEHKLNNAKDLATEAHMRVSEYAGRNYTLTRKANRYRAICLCSQVIILVLTYLQLKG